MFIAHALQLVEGQQYLAHLVCLGLAFVRLEIDPRISRPGRFEQHVAGAVLSRFAEVRLADLAEIREPDTAGFAAHLLEDLVGVLHSSMVSIVEPLFKG